MIDPFDVVPRGDVIEHLRVDEITPGIERAAKNALAYCLTYLDRDDILAADDVPEQVETAMLLLLTDMYEHRSAQVDRELFENPAARSFLDQVRSYRDKTVEVGDVS